MAHFNYGRRYVNHRPPPPELSVITPEQVAWVAGMIEGEGSFIIDRREGGRRTYASPRIQVSMTDRDVIERLRDLCGGRVAFEPQHGKMNRQDQWRWSLQGYDAVAALGPLILPWLGERRAVRYQEVMAIVEEVRACLYP